MKLQWIQNEPWGDEALPSWNLCLIEIRKHRDSEATLYQGRLGTIYKTETGYILLEKGNEDNPYLLDGDLTLDEAQRAAKLFLCVGVNK